MDSRRLALRFFMKVRRNIVNSGRVQYKAAYALDNAYIIFILVYKRSNCA
jgi:hypothetical protein